MRNPNGPQSKQEEEWQKKFDNDQFELKLDDSSDRKNSRLCNDR